MTRARPGHCPRADDAPRSGAGSTFHRSARAQTGRGHARDLGPIAPAQVLLSAVRIRAEVAKAARHRPCREQEELIVNQKGAGSHSRADPVHGRVLNARAWPGTCTRWSARAIAECKTDGPRPGCCARGECVQRIKITPSACEGICRCRGRWGGPDPERDPCSEQEFEASARSVRPRGVAMTNR